VESHDTRSGYNAYLYRRPEPTDGRPARTFLDRRALQESPGELIYFDPEIKPGGNRVRAFLDVAVTEPVDLQRVTDFLTEARGDLAAPADASEAGAGAARRARVPFLFDMSGVAIYFNADLGLDALAEFDALQGRVVRLIEQRGRKPFRDEAPLVVEVVTKDQTMVFTLRSESAQRVRDAKAVPWQPHPISISSETLGDFETLHGDFLFQLVLMITQMDEPGLARLGGVVVHGPSGKPVFEWPPRRHEHG
jgi:hypothetical protein